MTVHGLDHYNLRAPRALLDELCAFYTDVVGLSRGDRPQFARFGYWLYAGGVPVLHLSQADSNEECLAQVHGTFSHVSFACSHRDRAEQRLSAHGVPFRREVVPQTKRTQLFFQDPAGNGVELIFKSEEA